MIRFKDSKQQNEFYSDAVRRDTRLLAALAAAHIMTLYGVPLLITSVLGDPGVVRKTRTHEEGRAVDISVRDFTEDQALAVTDWINRWISTGARSAAGEPMLAAVYHNAGYGPHIHLQVARRPLIVGDGIII